MCMNILDSLHSGSLIDIEIIPFLATGIVAALKFCSLDRKESLKVISYLCNKNGLLVS